MFLQGSDVLLVQVHPGELVDPVHVVQVGMGHRHLHRQVRQLGHQPRQVPFSHARVNEQRLLPALHQVAAGGEPVVNAPHPGLQPHHLELSPPVLGQQPLHSPVLQGPLPGVPLGRAALLHLGASRGPQAHGQPLHVHRGPAVPQHQGLALHRIGPQGHIFQGAGLIGVTVPSDGAHPGEPLGETAPQPPHPVRRRGGPQQGHTALVHVLPLAQGPEQVRQVPLLGALHGHNGHRRPFCPGRQLGQGPLPFLLPASQADHQGAGPLLSGFFPKASQRSGWAGADHFFHDVLSFPVCFL